MYVQIYNTLGTNISISGWMRAHIVSHLQNIYTGGLAPAEFGQFPI